MFIAYADRKSGVLDKALLVNILSIENRISFLLFYGPQIFIPILIFKN